VVTKIGDKNQVHQKVVTKIGDKNHVTKIMWQKSVTKIVWQKSVTKIVLFRRFWWQESEKNVHVTKLNLPFSRI